MILFLIILSIILAIIIILYFIINLIINDKKNKSFKFYIINKLRKCYQPTIILLGANGRYGNIIKNRNDKILVFFVDDDEIYATFININNFQMINNNEDDVSSILANDGKQNLMAFSFNYRLFISSSYRVSSLQVKRDYYLPSNNHSFLNNEIGSFIITSLSPLIIKKINDINFKIIQDYMNVSWIDDNLLDATYIEIKSCPILINSYYWVLGTYKNKLILLIFNFVEKTIVNKIIKDIDDDITVFNGMIYNKLNDEFIIPISKNGKINIMTWKI